MTTKADTVLLIPEEGDPLGLLATRKCGSRPPMAYRQTDGHWLPITAWPFGDLPPSPLALVLAVDGEEHPDGCARLTWESWETKVQREWLRTVLLVALGKIEDDVDALKEPDLPGTLVLLRNGEEI